MSDANSPTDGSVDPCSSVIEMRLCESSRLVLRPGPLYRFSIAPGCDLCRREASAYEGDPTADHRERGAQHAVRGTPDSSVAEGRRGSIDVRATPRAIAVLVSLRRGALTTLQIRNAIADESTQLTRRLLECMSVDLIQSTDGGRWCLTQEGVAWLQRRGLALAPEK